MIRIRQCKKVLNFIERTDKNVPTKNKEQRTTKTENGKGKGLLLHDYGNDRASWCFNGLIHFRSSGEFRVPPHPTPGPGKDKMANGTLYRIISGIWDNSLRALRHLCVIRPERFLVLCPEPFYCARLTDCKARCSFHEWHYARWFLVRSIKNTQHLKVECLSLNDDACRKSEVAVSLMRRWEFVNCFTGTSFVASSSGMIINSGD